MLFTRRRYPACWGSCSREKSLLERLRKVLWTRLLVRWKSSRVKLPGLCPAYFIFSLVVFLKFLKILTCVFPQVKSSPMASTDLPLAKLVLSQVWHSKTKVFLWEENSYSETKVFLRRKFLLWDVFRRRKQKYSWTKVGNTSFLLSRKRLSTSLAKLTNLLSQVPMSFKINQLLIVLWWAF